MNPEIKAKWVAALRSGEYKQGSSSLKQQGGTMCCLGVLCDLYQKTYPEKSYWDHSTFNVKTAYGREHSSQVLLDNVANWAGLPERNPTPKHGLQSLALMNDRRVSFEQIADVIEQDEWE